MDTRRPIFLRRYRGRNGVSSGGGGGGGLGVWNAADKDANVTLSGADLTATASAGGSFIGCRGVTSHSSGKWAYAFTPAGSSSGSVSLVMGIGTASAALNNFVGSDASGNGFFSAAGAFIGSAYQGSGSSDTYPNGASEVDIVAADLSANLIWFFSPFTAQWNGSPTANPATGTGGLTISSGTYFMMFSGNSSAIAAATIVSATLPSGFSQWG